MEETKSKLCRMCYKQIDSRSKKCPYCHYWQSKLSMILCHPAFVLIPIMIALVVTWLIFKNTLDRGEDFTPYRGQIIIIESELKFGEDKRDGPTVVVIGKMINSSKVPWKDIRLEVRFYDRNRKLVDTGQEKIYSFVIPANDISMFKVSMPREFPEEQYETFEVRVFSAKDARTLW